MSFETPLKKESTDITKSKEEKWKKTRKIFLVKDQDGGDLYFYEWFPGADSTMDSFEKIVRLLRKLDAIERKKIRRAKKEKKNTSDGDHKLLYFLRYLIQRDQTDYENDEKQRKVAKIHLGEDATKRRTGSWVGISKNDLCRGKCRFFYFKLRV